MAIVQTGTTLQFGTNTTANSGTVSNTITVPADAEYVLVTLSAFCNISHYFSGGSMTFTKGGSQVAMAPLGQGNADSATGGWQGVMFGLVAPDTGTNKTLAFDWLGSSTSTDNVRNYVVTFWKGVNLSAPVRDSNSSTNGVALPAVTPSLNAQLGDLIVAAFCGFCGAQDGSGAVTVWSGATSYAEPPNAAYSEQSLATASPTGPQTVGLSTYTGYSEGALLAVVLAPALTVTAWQGSAAVSGFGSLGAALRQTLLAPGAGWAGAGILSAAPARLLLASRPAALGGAGALTADLLAPTHTQPGTAALTGSGVAHAAAALQMAARAFGQGSGTLAASLRHNARSGALWAGAGALRADAIPVAHGIHLLAPRGFAGAGRLAARLVATAQGASRFGGSGRLTVAASLPSPPTAYHLQGQQPAATRVQGQAPSTIRITGAPPQTVITS